MTLADRIVVLEYGHIAQVGTPRELYERPANLFVAQFIGSPKMNILPCSISDGQYHLAAGGCAPYPFTQSAKHVGVRPEHIQLTTPNTGSCDARVEVIEYLGADTFLIMDYGGIEKLTVRVSGDTDLEVGQTVGLLFKPDHMHFFDGNDQRISN